MVKLRTARQALRNFRSAYERADAAIAAAKRRLESSEKSVFVASRRWRTLRLQTVKWDDPTLPPLRTLNLFNDRLPQFDRGLWSLRDVEQGLSTMKVHALKAHILASLSASNPRYHEGLLKHMTADMDALSRHAELLHFRPARARATAVFLFVLAYLAACAAALVALATALFAVYHRRKMRRGLWRLPGEGTDPFDPFLFLLSSDRPLRHCAPWAVPFEDPFYYNRTGFHSHPWWWQLETLLPREEGLPNAQVNVAHCDDRSKATVAAAKLNEKLHASDRQQGGHHGRSDQQVGDPPAVTVVTSEKSEEVVDAAAKESRRARTRRILREFRRDRGGSTGTTAEVAPPKRRDSRKAVDPPNSTLTLPVVLPSTHATVSEEAHLSGSGSPSARQFPSDSGHLSGCASPTHWYDRFLSSRPAPPVPRSHKAQSSLEEGLVSGAAVALSEWKAGALPAPSTVLNNGTTEEDCFRGDIAVRSPLPLGYDYDPKSRPRESTHNRGGKL